MSKKTIQVDTSLFIKAVGDCIRNKILEFFIEGREFDYPIKYLAEEIGVNRNTLYKAIDELLSSKLIAFSRRIGSSKFYKLNLSDPIALDFVKLFDKIINIEMEKYIEREKPIFGNDINFTLITKDYPEMGESNIKYCNIKEGLIEIRETA
ncbi:winged helix-turn-helix transcriptional regulator [Candidatus Woesearchaeota archaeon]|nr:winged helix-turn-helix transcriptional regulator [Candidatus Woesearchaeota archaeon]